MLQISKDFTVVQDGTSYIAIAAEAPKIVRLNEDGKYLWDEFYKGTSIDEVVKKIVKAYDVSSENARGQVCGFVEMLKKHGMLMETTD